MIANSGNKDQQQWGTSKFYPIDTILFYLQKFNYEEPIHETDIFFECKMDELSHVEKNAIINKLKKDGLIETYQYERKTSHVSHDGYTVEINKFTDISLYITWEGTMFDGYEKAFNDKTTENIRFATLEIHQKYHRRFMTWLTAILSVGTSIAAWYYAIEIWKYYHTKTM